jgi:hypothetical protein
MFVPVEPTSHVTGGVPPRGGGSSAPGRSGLPLPRALPAVAWDVTETVRPVMHPPFGHMEEQWDFSLIGGTQTAVAPTSGSASVSEPVSWPSAGVSSNTDPAVDSCASVPSAAD